MKIDVILPTFNRSHTLQRAIDSVLSQTNQNFQLYIVNDGSTDDTHQILDKYQHPRLTVLEQENRGVSSARNFGVSKSTAEWVSFLDSDDEWLPEKLEENFKYLKHHPECNFLHSEEIWIRNGKRVNPGVRHSKSLENLFERSLDLCLISPSTVLMKRDLFNKYNGFNESFIVCEDYELWLKILARQEVGFINKHLVKKYGGHDDQLSTKYPAMDYYRLKSLIELIQQKEVSQEKKNLIHQTIQRKAEILLKGLEKHGHLDKCHEIRLEISKINIGRESGN